MLWVGAAMGFCCLLPFIFIVVWSAVCWVEMQTATYGSVQRRSPILTFKTIFILLVMLCFMFASPYSSILCLYLYFFPVFSRKSQRQQQRQTTMSISHR